WLRRRLEELYLSPELAPAQHEMDPAAIPPTSPLDPLGAVQSQAPMADVSEVIPRWDRATRQLWLGDELVRTYTRHAPAQFTLLDPSQKAGWPFTLPNPLTHSSAKDAVGELNHHAAATRLRFQLGEGGDRSCIRWSLTPV